MADEPTTNGLSGERGARNAQGALLKQERAHQTREAILLAAATCFAERGFPAVTILSVAEQAGMTKGAVYFHFTNKESLAYAVTEEFYGRLAGLAETVQGAGMPPLATAIELMRRTARVFRDDLYIHAGARLQIERAYIDISLPAPFVGYLGVLTELLREASRRGELPPGTDPDALARVFSSSFFGAQHISWIIEDRKDLPERTEEIIRFLFPGTAAG